MNITVSANDLARLLDNAKGLVERSLTMPVLQNVLLAAEAPDLTLRGTDLQTAYTGRCTAMVARPGELCLPARKLAEVAKALPAENALLEADGLDLRVEAGAVRYLIRGLDPADYPPEPENGVIPVTLEGQALRGALCRVAYATANDGDQPWRSSVLFEVRADGADLALRLVATDGHRLSICDLDLGEPPARDDLLALPALLLPVKAAGAMVRLLRDGEAVLGLSPGLATLRVGQDTLHARPYDCAFPGYEEILPKKPGHRAVAGREALIAAIKRVAVMETAKLRRLHLELADGVMALEAADDALGQASESLEVAWDGPYLELAINAGYLLDALGALTSEEVTLEMGGEKTPVVITAGDDEADAGFRGLIMPMDLQKPKGPAA